MVSSDSGVSGSRVGGFKISHLNEIRPAAFFAIISSPLRNNCRLPADSRLRLHSSPFHLVIGTRGQPVRGLCKRVEKRGYLHSLGSSGWASSASPRLRVSTC